MFVYASLESKKTAAKETKGTKGLRKASHKSFLLMWGIRVNDGRQDAFTNTKINILANLARELKFAQLPTKEQIDIHWVST